MGKITDPVTMPNETERIRQEIRHTEAEITDTLHSIEEKFTPAHVREEIKGKLLHFSVTGMTNLTETVRRRPIPAALIGAGAIWFLIRRRRNRRKTAGAAEIGAAAMEALPETAKKEPVRTLKHYISLGRMALALGSVLSMMLFRENKVSPPYMRRRADDLAEIPPAGVAGMP